MMVAMASTNTFVQTVVAERLRGRVMAFYADRQPQIEYVDGVSAAFGRWRFNLRSSNTEPLLRLNVETRGDQAQLQAKTAELRSLIGSPPT